MYKVLLVELEKQGKIKQGNIEIYTANGGLKVSDGKNTYGIKDNNMLVNLTIKNNRISKVVDDILKNYL